MGVKVQIRDFHSKHSYNLGLGILAHTIVAFILLLLPILIIDPLVFPDIIKVFILWVLRFLMAASIITGVVVLFHTFTHFRPVIWYTSKDIIDRTKKAKYYEIHTLPPKLTERSKHGRLMLFRVYELMHKIACSPIDPNHRHYAVIISSLITDRKIPKTLKNHFYSGQPSYLEKAGNVCGETLYSILGLRKPLFFSKNYKVKKYFISMDDLTDEQIKLLWDLRGKYLKERE
ncbi:hypothetical protein ABES02_29080 [Neobacillus pocheonensis]|uniref:hypothetical protein n=1 Tax=Neobacillus pocheonensis TaxID=363869 RepID=UPI003D27A8D0